MSLSAQSPIDHSKGHAFLHNGNLYYSPNSSRHITIPERPTGTGSRYRFHKKDAHWERFHDPQWWTLEYCFLSFVPLRPSFQGETFSTLRDILPFITASNENFGLHYDKVTSWIELEDWTLYISALLDQTNYTYPALKPIPPSFLGFQKQFMSSRSARLRATISRDWFIIWMGLLSFKIAAVPDWFDFLARKGVPQIWLNHFQISTVCNFSENCPRVGIIIDWLQPHDKKPKVEWFTSHNVPVWYPWTPNHAKAASNPRFYHLRPPVHLLQAATTLSPIPSLSQTRFDVTPSESSSHEPPPHSQSHEPPEQPTTTNTTMNMSSKEFNAAREAHIKTKPWSKFFEARSIQNEAQLQRETDEQRQRRINRERKPPTISAEVYEWDWSDEDPLVLIRNRVRKKEREDVLGSYRKSESRYDSFQNIWDVCHYFGNNSDNETEENAGQEGIVDGDDYSDDDDDNYTQGEQDSHSTYMSKRIHQLSSVPNAISWPTTQFQSEVEIDLSENVKRFELLEHLCLFYGFVPPLENNSSSWNNDHWDEVMKSIGWFAGDQNPPLKGFEANIIKFIKDLCSGRNTPELSDLNRDNYRAIILSDLDEVIFRVPILDTELYAVRHVNLKDPPCPWYITLTNAKDALFVYRLLRSRDFSAISLSKILLENGITFRTLQELRVIDSSRTLKNDEMSLPMRLAGYTFKPNDYEVYIRHRAHFLKSPRGRAALLRGGIVARIAREHIGLESATLGPSSAVTVHRLGMHVTHDTGSQFWDDDLTENEIGIICGLHRCLTGKGSQVALVSWWPMPTQWDNIMYCGFNLRHWTQWDEHWYLKRLKDIAEGTKDGIPFNASTWKSKIKGAASTRALNKSILEHSKKLF